MKKCPFCPCYFETEHDFSLHMETFGWKKEEHLHKFYEVHKRMEWWSDNG